LNSFTTKTLDYILSTSFDTNAYGDTSDSGDMSQIRNSAYTTNEGVILNIKKDTEKAALCLTKHHAMKVHGGMEL
jgi:hypothetical protein